MAKKDVLQRFLEARAELRKEYDALTKRLNEIDAVLRKHPVGSSPIRMARAQNSMTIREAVTQALERKPLRLAELEQAVRDLGYQFSSSDPKNSLGAYLYGPGKHHFKRVDGRFSIF